MSAVARAERFWSQVAAFGALWGAIEITLGSFLHALRFPFCGVLLACLGALLLVSARQIVPDRGSTLATGIVAALCKSISPGGVILGPMIAIALEALLVEVALLVAPRGRISAALAGTLSALWASSQKLFGQVVFYGGSILSLYLALLRRARDWLALPDQAGWWALAIFILLHVLLGATAGLLGRRVGAEAQARLAASPAAGEIPGA